MIQLVSSSLFVHPLLPNSITLILFWFVCPVENKKRAGKGGAVERMVSVIMNHLDEPKVYSPAIEALGLLLADGKNTNKTQN